MSETMENTSEPSSWEKYRLTTFMVSIVCLLGFFQDLFTLFQVDTAVGVDGYYYVLQVDTLKNHGHFYYPTSYPLILYILTLVSHVLSNTVLAVKLSSILFHFFLNLAVYNLIKTVTKSSLWGLYGLIICAFSNLHFYQIAEFINNLGALTFLIWSFTGFLKYQFEKNFKWLIFSAGFGIAAIFSHRSLIFLVSILGLFGLTTLLLLNQKYKKAVLYVLLPAIVVLFLSPCILSNQEWIILPEAFRAEILKSPKIPFNHLNFVYLTTLALVSTIAIVIFFRQKSDNKIAQTVLLTIVFFSVFFTLNPFLNYKIGFQQITGRLASLAYIQVSIALPVLLSLLNPRKKSLALALIYLPLFLTLDRVVSTPATVMPQAVKKQKNLADDLRNLRIDFCDKPLVIAPHGEQFMVTSILDVPAQQSLPKNSDYECVFWLIHAPENERNFQFVEDSEIKEVLKNLNREERRRLIHSNPHLLEISQF